LAVPKHDLAQGQSSWALREAVYERQCR
jgi:hypothetical protein